MTNIQMHGENPISLDFQKGVFKHFMIKEIHEQPKTVRLELDGRIKKGIVDLYDLGMDDILARVEKIYMIGCGTAYHAGLVGKDIIEKLVRVNVESDIASEFGYRDILWGENQLMIVISQSGETADTLVALREAKRHGIPILAITNVVGSTVAQEADKVIYTLAGPEISIASTKAYTSQLVVVYLLALYMAQLRMSHDEKALRTIGNELSHIGDYLEEVFEQEEKIIKLAWQHHQMQSVFYLGRGLDCAVAMEGALKLKETSYIHAEAYATGELKHGPIALITDQSPVITLLTQNHMVERSMYNIQEVKTRGGKVIAVCKADLQEQCRDCDDIITIPNVNSIITPILSVVPLQMFAYYMATLRGNNVDQPRNLTKSVQIE
ncbi:MAG TPA: glutamine--fructose-6-phosphate transaminase (isomerizing) [Syntrophomonadaceae bacterium]|nr:glutamine--fructose-6-phosphate transaminase (isomerizing) [Syntrophomonadaceae bacterium]